MATTTENALQSDQDTGNDSQSAVQKLRDQADAVVQRIQPQIAAVSTYARNEPTKALLISAATGAALMGLIALMVRSGNRSSASAAASSTFSSIREAALDLADSAQSMVADALDRTQKRAAAVRDTAQKGAAAARDTAQKRAASALEAAQERASSAADSVSESVAEAWQKVRDQAAPVVDKVRPQVEAAANYVREDPARAALGLAAAGAVIAGLVALARQASDSSLDETLPY
jgi:ElaB/YqjD/DUF883 family membrane-anchored ribosome-binding protein